MARYKPTAKKRRLIKAGKMSKPVPAWIVAKTRGKIRVNRRRRNWRRSKIRA